MTHFTGRLAAIQRRAYALLRRNPITTEEAHKAFAEIRAIADPAVVPPVDVAELEPSTVIYVQVPPDFDAASFRRVVDAAVSQLRVMRGAAKNTTHMGEVVAAKSVALAERVNALRAALDGLPEHWHQWQWAADPKPVFGSTYVRSVVGDNGHGMGRQVVADVPASKHYFGTLADFIAAANPDTIRMLLDAFAETARLRRELAARAIRTMGPSSPYWNCTICGAAHTTPIAFEHKADCILSDEPHPPKLLTATAPVVDHYAADTADLDPARVLVANCIWCRCRIYEGDAHHVTEDDEHSCFPCAPKFAGEA